MQRVYSYNPGARTGHKVGGGADLDSTALSQTPAQLTPPLSTSAVVFHYKEALYQVYAPLSFTFNH